MLATNYSTNQSSQHHEDRAGLSTAGLGEEMVSKLIQFEKEKYNYVGNASDYMDTDRESSIAMSSRREGKEEVK